jgi:hypothetical protein
VPGMDGHEDAMRGGADDQEGERVAVVVVL